ncbi:MAG: hypothetical protein WCY10_05540, partial [Candidatus Omnitrophota bacterium]
MNGRAAKGDEMFNFLNVLAFLVVFIGFTAGGSFAQSREWQNISREIVAGICVLEDRADPQTIYLGTANGLYKTQDAGLNWKRVFNGRSIGVNQIAFDPSDAAHVLAGTSKGVYDSHDAGANWKNIFRSSNAYEADCRVVIAGVSALYAGTRQGLMVSADGGVRWNKESGALGKISILAIAADATKEGYIYVAACDGVYRKKISAGAWEKVLNAWMTENTDESDLLDPEALDVSPQGCAARSICVDPDNPGTVYLATTKGVLSSHDSAATWTDLPGSGLSVKDVRVVTAGPGGGLYAATRSDVYFFSGGTWQRVGNGIIAGMIQGLACGARNVYAACDTGLYFTGYNKPRIDPARAPEDFYSKGFPSIAAVHQAAIAYADVDIKKIAKWRRQARNKALLPSVGVGINKDTSELWHWEGGSTTKE